MNGKRKKKHTLTFDRHAAGILSHANRFNAATASACASGGWHHQRVKVRRDKTDLHFKTQRRKEKRKEECGIAEKNIKERKCVGYGMRFGYSVERTLETT